jgi:hypothetical protein
MGYWFRRWRFLLFTLTPDWNNEQALFPLDADDIYYGGGGTSRKLCKINIPGHRAEDI